MYHVFFNSGTALISSIPDHKIGIKDIMIIIEDPDSNRSLGSYEEWQALGKREFEITKRKNLEVRIYERNPDRI
jgi:hypothetical protein